MAILGPRDSFQNDPLVRYLLGTLPDDEAEWLEEQSIVDDQLAERLRLIEDDLVDAYASGQLSGEMLRRFESFYLASPRRRNKAAFAKRLLATIDTPDEPVASESAAPRAAQTESRWTWLAAAVASLCVIAGVVIVQNIRLSRDVAVAQHAVTAAEERAAALSTRLGDQQRATAAAAKALSDARAEPSPSIALVLMPQTRGLGPVPILAVASGTGAVPLELEIDASRTASYEVALRDPATNRVIWRSGPLVPQRARRPAVVPVPLPRELLKAQHYELELFGVRPGGEPEFAGSYAFEVVRR